MFVWRLHYALLKGAFCYVEAKGSVRFKIPLACLPRSGFVQQRIMFSQSLEHNRCYQDASPSIPFCFQRAAVTPSGILRMGCTRLRLVSQVLKGEVSYSQFILPYFPRLTRWCFDSSIHVDLIRNTNQSPGKFYRFRTGTSDLRVDSN